MSYLKERVFEMLGIEWAKHDPNKDIAGKGTIQRFTEANWQYWDEEFEPIVSDIVAVLVNPLTAHAGVLEPIEYSLGIKPDEINLFSTDLVRRKIMLYIKRIAAIKGTKKSFSLLFNLIGFDCVIIEDWAFYSFDSPVTFDDPDRRFDMGKCTPCTSFEIQITSRESAPGTPLTAEEQAAADSIIAFCTPINATLSALTIM